MPDSAEHRRMVALTVELVKRKELPAFYVAPPKRNKLEQALQRRLSRELAGLAGGLIEGLGAGTLGLSNEGAIAASLAEEVEVATNGVQTAYEEAYLISAEDSFNREAAQILSRSGVGLEWDLVQPQARQVLKDQSFQASKALMDRVVGDVNKTLLGGFDEGLGTREIGKNLTGVIRNLRSRDAEGIARTEINSAGNTGNFLALKTANVEYMQWISAQDARVRTSHMLQHGLVVKREERFPNNLQHPGDRDGRLEEWINCRCAGVAYFPTNRDLLKDTPYVGRA
ncbi:MAG: hypothetical protein H8E48_08155 [Chloroflexi bacterium]|nr:hypothetical protein [Chloroflexota bacterium]